VAAGSEPTIKPYRAYINADVAEANIVALLLPGIETGINGIVAERGMGVFNGDLGMIRSINPYTEVITVEFEEGKFADYTFKQADELELAYATTIHKAQGSEYPAVVIPLLGGPRMLMTRNLLYTAVTRARKCVTIVGSDVTFQAMIGNHIEANRYTTLARRIREMQEENA
jgi:exodeoxyribonuclease V alpha subunit